MTTKRRRQFTANLTVGPLDGPAKGCVPLRVIEIDGLVPRRHQAPDGIDSGPREDVP